MPSSCTSSSSLNFQGCGQKPLFNLQSQWSPETHLLPVRSAWETSARNPSISFVWRNAPRISRDFESALPFQTRLTQTKPVIPLSNEHGSQVKDEGRWQRCHNKHNKFPYRPTREASLLSGHASYINLQSNTSLIKDALDCKFIYISINHWKYNMDVSIVSYNYQSRTHP